MIGGKKKKVNSQVVTGRLVSLAVFVSTLFCSSPAACILCGKSSENEIGFLGGADGQNGLMTLASGHEPQTQLLQGTRLALCSCVF